MSRKEIKQLADQILHHKRLYYSGKQEISDKEYDKLERKLSKLSPDHPVLSLVDTNEKVKGKTVPLDPPMLSLDKITNDGKSVLSKMSKHIVSHQEHDEKGFDELIVSDKLDGIACSLFYKESDNGYVFYQACTRATKGKLGSDITLAAFHIEFPKTIPGKVNQIRGELVMPKSVMKEYKAWGEKSGKTSGKIIRNALSGLITRKTLHPEWLSKCWFIPYIVIKGEKQGFNKTYEQDLTLLESWGFHTMSWKKVDIETTDADEFERMLIKRTKKSREYETDGQVIRINSNRIWNLLGNTGHHPRGSLAFKVGGEEHDDDSNTVQRAETTILSITHAVTRTGKISFVANVEPVKVGEGVTMSNANISNLKFIHEHRYYPGARVIIERCNKVIPNLKEIIEPATEKWHAPTYCPSCKSKLEIYGRELMCKNSNCPAKDVTSFIHFATTLEIEGVSEATITKLIDEGLVQKWSDLWRLKTKHLANLDGFGEKSALNKIEAIQAKKEIPLSIFLQSLNISGLGKQKSNELVDKFTTLKAIRRLDIEDLEALHGWGSITSQKIVQGLKDKSDTIDDLLQVITIVERKKSETKRNSNKDGKISGIAGKNIAITGKLGDKPRKTWEELITGAGGKLVSGISKNTHYLASDEASDSAKSKKAEQLGIKVLTSEKLLQLLG